MMQLVLTVGFILGAFPSTDMVVHSLAKRVFFVCADETWGWELFTENSMEQNKKILLYSF